MRVRGHGVTVQVRSRNKTSDPVPTLLTTRTGTGTKTGSAIHAAACMDLRAENTTLVPRPGEVLCKAVFQLFVVLIAFLSLVG